MSCDIPVRVIALTEQEYNNAKNKIEAVGDFSDLRRHNAIRGKDFFDQNMNLYSNYRDIVRKKYPNLRVPKNTPMLSPQAEKSLRYNDKRTVYDFHNAGAVGCALSHISAWQEMVDNNIPQMIIFESDVDFAKKDFCNRLNTIIENYQQPFDILNFNLLPIPFPLNDYTEIYDTKIPDVRVAKGIAFRLQGYMLTLEGAKKLLLNAFPLIYEVDSYVTMQSILPSTNLTILATSEPWLNHPVIVFGSSIGYSPTQCLTDGMFFVPQTILLLSMAVLILLTIAALVYGCYLLYHYVAKLTNNNESSAQQNQQPNFVK